MMCLICNETKRLNKGICQTCRDRILRPHYIDPIKEIKPAGSVKNGK
jgi:hypothetical protein